MIFLITFVLSAMASEPEDRSEDLFRVFCDNCHGENMEIIPLNPKTTTEDRIYILNQGRGAMPPYSWVLKDGEDQKLITFLENK